MEAQPITASVNVLGTDYPVQSVRLTKRVGHLTTGTAQIQLQQSEKGQPMTGGEVSSLSEAFNSAILNKTDGTPNVRVNLVDQIDFEGILLGCRGSTDASGQASFSVSFAEPAYMLNSMNLNCYPSGESPMGIRSKAEVKHPFAAKANARGSIANRIGKLYQTALESVEKQDTEAARYFNAQQQTNLALNSVFSEFLNRSNGSTNPEWLREPNVPLSEHLNDVLATVLFSESHNLWQALMKIAHATNLIYAGDFGAGGRLRELELDAGGGATDLSAPPLKSVNLNLGRSREQTIGQVSAYAPARDAYYGKFMPRSAAVNTLRGTTVGQQLAAYPLEPSPTNGKVVTVQAPSWFAVGREVVKRAADKYKILDGKDEAATVNLVELMGGRIASFEAVRESNNEALRLWCREYYNILRTRNIRAQVKKPFTTNEYQLGAPATVAEGLTGALSGVSHEVTINGDTGTAFTSYDVSYVGGAS